MSLNTNTVNSTRLIDAEAMIVDSIQQDPPIQLPLDIILIILKNLPTSKLSTLFLVCKDWRIIVDNDDFLNKMILPPNFNGPERWVEYTKADAGNAPNLPRWVFKLMQNGEHMLTFIPETVKITNKDGTEKEEPINSLERVGSLFSHVINKRKISFSTNSWKEAIQEVRPTEKGHWVLISKKAKGRGLNHQQQVDEVKKEGAITPNLIDTVISFFMEYLRTGQCQFSDNPRDKNELSTWIRVDTIWLSFVTSSLHVHGSDSPNASGNLAVVSSCKFF